MITTLNTDNRQVSFWFQMAKNFVLGGCPERVCLWNLSMNQFARLIFCVFATKESHAVLNPVNQSFQGLGRGGQPIGRP